MKLKPYSFTINNTCDLFVSYNVSLEILKDSTIPIKYVRSMLNKEAVVNLNTLESTTKSISDSIDSKVLTSGSLGSGDSADYTLRIWMDEDVTVDDTDAINKTLLSKVIVTAVPSSYSPVANGFTNLAEALLVNEYQTTNVDVAKNKIASKQTVDTTKTAPIIDWQEVHENTSIDYQMTKASVEAIGTYGVTEVTTQIAISDTYSFDSSTGYYTLVDYEFVVPSDIDFTAKDYYVCGGGINTTSANTITYSNGYTCTTLKKIVELKNVYDSTRTFNNGEKVPVKIYLFIVNYYTEKERESDKSDKGLYETQDDYGTTYYYRGNVTNNYVKFAGYYWRVIRINGDGSVRMLYSGNNGNATGDDLMITTSSFNVERKDPTYVGYMYSNTLKTSYEDALKNDNNSTIKTPVDNWYKANILDAGYSGYIADSGFCSDREKRSGDGYSTTTYYTSNTRWQNASPTYICSNQASDLFTLNGNVIGNKSLIYPIGLITADELMFGGYAYGYLNPMSYLYSTTSYWTMTPSVHDATTEAAQNFLLYIDGSIIRNWVTSRVGVRPVINLKADTEITGGIGTKNDPFIVK